MQNAQINYKIRIEKGEHENREVEITMTLSQFEKDWSIIDELFDKHEIMGEGWDENFYTVLERHIELLED